MSWQERYAALMRTARRERRRQWRKTHRRIDYTPAPEVAALIDARTKRGRSYSAVIDELILDAATRPDTGIGVSPDAGL